MKIQVTQKDINEGARFSSLIHPVTLAIRRATSRCTTINDKYAHVQKLVGFHEIALPRFAADWIRRFNEGFDIEPFHFELKLPADWKGSYPQPYSTPTLPPGRKPLII